MNFRTDRSIRILLILNVRITRNFDNIEYKANIIYSIIRRKFT